ncbi:hypothetical protein PWF83_18950 [Pantoea dispersa]|uniref:hypothetical protein n=1 Tax=Pantoea dispersa TaxID=59814 RepID=UPI0023A9EB23|nr:hypothetical protein [Pantoea dispersa]WEA05743.1 hypothetical protein PWF83_18950 [Pantoea dispersa]
MKIAYVRLSHEADILPELSFVSFNVRPAMFKQAETPRFPHFLLLTSSLTFPAADNCCFFIVDCYHPVAFKPGQPATEVFAEGAAGVGLRFHTASASARLLNFVSRKRITLF